MKKTVVAIFLLFLVTPVYAQEISLSAGMAGNIASRDKTYSFQIEYLRMVTETLAWSISLINEGHLSDDHRDGLTFQLWEKLSVTDHFFVKGGLGPYFFMDSKDLTNTHYRHEHGLGGVFSLGLEWDATEAFSIQLRTNWIITNNAFNSNTLLLGFGFKTDSSPKSSQSEYKRWSGHQNAVTPFIGFLSSNNNDTGNPIAWGLEYRHDFRYASWSVLAMDEGDEDNFHRRGIATQLWFSDSFCNGRLVFGLALGPYVAQNVHRDRLTGKDGTILAGIVTLGVSYLLSPGWALRFNWNRVITDYNRDTDVFLIGPSFFF